MCKYLNTCIFYLIYEKQIITIGICKHKNIYDSLCLFKDPQTIIYVYV